MPPAAPVRPEPGAGRPPRGLPSAEGAPADDHPLTAVAALPGVADAVAEAREACERLRWHRGLRRGWAAARVESGVHAVRAGLVVDGLRVPVDLVRDVVRGASSAPAGPEGEAVRAAVRVQAQVEGWMRPPGATGRPAALPAGQVLARLATLAGAAPGMPRADDCVGEVTGLGPPPPAAEVAGRVQMLQDLLDAPRGTVPALVVGAVALGELLVLRPFARGNAVVGRALLRHVLVREGTDPVGVVVPESLWSDRPVVHVATAAQYATGTAEGVAAWVRHCAAAVVAGAAVGESVAESVLAGRLADGPGPVGR